MESEEKIEKALGIAPRELELLLLIFHLARLKRIKEEVAQGRYKPELEQVSEKLIKEELWGQFYFKEITSKKERGKC